MGELTNGLEPLEIPVKIQCRHTSLLSVDPGLQPSVHGVHPIDPAPLRTLHKKALKVVKCALFADTIAIQFEHVDSHLGRVVLSTTQN